MPDATALPWGFYGRSRELGQLRSILEPGRWFFLKIAGRRRIGKTELVRHALGREAERRVVYLQIPDSDPAGVVATACEYLRLFEIAGPLPVNLSQLAQTIGRLVRAGHVVALDEFQYFHRRSLFPFTSFLQREVDALLHERSSDPRGGLIVLGSIHTEMSALLEDRSAPLFARLTHEIDLPHLDVGAILEILRAHAEPDPWRLLFLWSLFEGVPKFYRDAHAFGVLGADRRTLLARLFFQGAAPLATEAENWFLRELHGRYDLVLKYIARHAGCTHKDIVAHTQSVDAEAVKHVNGYLRVLTERYEMVERLQPVFAKPRARSGRLYLRDNFLRSWLAGLDVTTAAVDFRDEARMIAEADTRLQTVEGKSLERLARVLYHERSRRGLGDFSLTEAVNGYWDRRDTELDLVALDEERKIVRLGTCKRSADKLAADFARFDGHVRRFLEVSDRVRGWRVEKVAITVEHTSETRRAAERAGYLPQDLTDLTSDL